jgi:hypothetical protein
MIIGIGHNIGVGKDTAAQALVRALGYRQVAFADKLRDLAMFTDPLIQTGAQAVNIDAGRGRLAWTVRGVGWEDAKKHYPEIRSFLQKLGVGARQVFGDEFWIEQALAGAAKGARVVVSDVRFLNEAEKIHSLGGRLIKIEREGFYGDSHVSEQDLVGFQGWDTVITNDGDVVDLERKVIEYVAGELQRATDDDES